MAIQILNNGELQSISRKKINDNFECLSLDTSNGIFLYTHSLTGAVHTLSGSGANGKFKAISGGTVSSFTVNGTVCTVKQGEGAEIELVAGCWYTFILDGAQVNFKSGGAALNFKVVGGTAAPVNPQENTLWVNTDKPIAGWSFLYTRYTGTSPDGWLQIICGGASNTSFNALKKNELLVYPIQCIQYINGSWKNIESSIYQNRIWVNFILILLDGKYTNPITGGFIGTHISGGSNVLTQNDNGLTLVSTGSEDRLAIWTTDKPIDFTNISRIKITCKYNGGTIAYGNRIGIFSQKNSPTAIVSAVPTTVLQEYTLDTSNVNGNYYIQQQLYCQHSAAGYMYCQKIVLEP